MLSEFNNKLTNRHAKLHKIKTSTCLLKVFQGLLFKTGPAEHASTANQIQGFRIPDRKNASEKINGLSSSRSDVQLTNNMNCPY